MTHEERLEIERELERRDFERELKTWEGKATAPIGVVTVPADFMRRLLDEHARLRDAVAEDRQVSIRLINAIPVVALLAGKSGEIDQVATAREVIVAALKGRGR